MEKNSYSQTLNEILKTDRIVKSNDETMETVRGNIKTIWNRISAHKFVKHETVRLGVSELSN